MQFVNSHGHGESCVIRTTEPRCCDIATLARNELKTLLHKVKIYNQEIFLLPFSFGYNSIKLSHLHLINSRHILAMFTNNHLEFKGL